MDEQFEAVVDGHTYLLKRIYHEELPLTYHIHHRADNRLLIFRMGLVKDQWQLLQQNNLPLHIYQAEKGLIKAITINEKKAEQ